jgi:hypothetical protein
MAHKRKPPPIMVPAHTRAHPTRKPPMPPGAPMPGPNEFDAGQEQAMRAGRRAANMPQPAPSPQAPDMGDDELAGM